MKQTFSKGVSLIIAVVICLSLLPMTALADSRIPTELDAPLNPKAEIRDDPIGSGPSGGLYIIVDVPQSISDYLGNDSHSSYGVIPEGGFDISEGTIFLQVDISVNSKTDWQCTDAPLEWRNPAWSIIGSLDTKADVQKPFERIVITERLIRNGYESLFTDVDDWKLYGTYDLSDKTIYFRTRFVWQDHTEVYPFEITVFSEWSTIFELADGGIQIKTDDFSPNPNSAYGKWDIPSATVGQPYSLQMKAHNDVGNNQSAIVWSASGLPEGLMMSEDGLISGTPKMSGAGTWYTVNIKVKSGNYDDNESFRLFVNSVGDAPPTSTTDKPSTWATEQVIAAINNSLVPQALQSQYTQATTRAEFAALAVTLYEQVTGTTITERKTFDDTSDINVEKAAAIGIVSGVGDNKFDPNAGLTREQAAVMLSRLADAIGKPLDKQAATFADNDSIATWAIAEVGQIQAAGIMSGVGENTFAPQSAYTREQSIVTIMRLYEVLK